MKEKFKNREGSEKFGEIFFLENEYWQATVSSYGGQLLSAAHCSSEKEVIYFGAKAAAGNGQALRGGVPVCWPWFGASSVPGRPIQGFARTAMWEAVDVEKDFLRLKLPRSAVPEEFVDFPFELLSEIRLTEALENTLVMRNCGKQEVELSCALHTYFAVSDCEKITVTGFQHTPFTVKGGPEQRGEKEFLRINGELCRLYAPQTERVTLIDPRWKRSIVISKENSASTLVWNPGAERCRQITDLEDEEFHRFLCIECNRAGRDTITLPPCSEEKISQKITLEKEETICIRDIELTAGSQGLLYQGKAVIDVERLPDGSDIMYFCDKNKNPLPGSPRIICSPVHYD